MIQSLLLLFVYELQDLDSHCFLTTEEVFSDLTGLDSIKLTWFSRWRWGREREGGGGAAVSLTRTHSGETGLVSKSEDTHTHTHTRVLSVLSEVVCADSDKVLPSYRLLKVLHSPALL